jgi:hypothetical protein
VEEAERGDTRCQSEKSALIARLTEVEGEKTEEIARWEGRVERLRMEKDLCQDELDRRGRNAPIEMEPRASIATAIGGVLTPQPPEEIDPGRDAGGASPPPDGDTMANVAPIGETTMEEILTAASIVFETPVTFTEGVSHMVGRTTRGTIYPGSKLRLVINEGEMPDEITVYKKRSAESYAQSPGKGKVSSIQMKYHELQDKTVWTPESEDQLWDGAGGVAIIPASLKFERKWTAKDHHTFYIDFVDAETATRHADEGDDVGFRETVARVGNTQQGAVPTSINPFEASKAIFQRMADKHARNQ